MPKTGKGAKSAKSAKSAKGKRATSKEKQAPEAGAAPLLGPLAAANRAAWDATADDYQRLHHRALAGDVLWGPSMPPESALRILPDLRGKDVLEIGCGGGQAVVHAKKALGARRAAGVDVSAAQLAHARRHAARARADVEFVEASAEDLSAFASRSFDVAFSAFAYGFVPDVDRAFAEAFRVLRPGGSFAFSWSSPLHAVTDLTSEGLLIVSGSYFNREPFRWTEEDGTTTVEFPRTYGDWLRALVRAGFVVEDVVEPEPTGAESAYGSHPLAKVSRVPGTTVWKARKPVRVTPATKAPTPRARPAGSAARERPPRRS